MNLSALLALALAATAAAQVVPSQRPLIMAGPGGIARDGEYIVSLRPNVSLAELQALRTSALATTVGGVLSAPRTFTAAIRGFVVAGATGSTRRDALMAVLRSSDLVDFVEQSQVYNVTASGSQAGAVPWGLDRVDDRSRSADATYEYLYSGEGVEIHVVDTGVRRTHTEFGGRAVHGFTAHGSDSLDGNGHGTHVAGTAAGATFGVAKDARVVAVKVLDDDGTGSTADIIAGLEWIAVNARRPAVASLSLGGGPSSALDSAVRKLVAAGIPVVVAAGNDNENACGTSPAREASAITVAATERGDDRASYSNFGECVDIFAPGTDILSAWHTSDVATQAISGTSMATPHVSGAIALLGEFNNDLTAKSSAEAVLCASTKDAVNDAQGAPNRLLFTLIDSAGNDGDDDEPAEPDEGCTAESPCESESGALDAGDGAFFPAGSNLTVPAGSGERTLRGWLSGTSSMPLVFRADFDLYLFQYQSSSDSWGVVDSSSGSGNSHAIKHSVPAAGGVYAWRVENNGNGNGTFQLQYKDAGAEPDALPQDASDSSGQCNVTFVSAAYPQHGAHGRVLATAAGLGLAATVFLLAGLF